MPTRLNKFLVEAGVCSRREADRLIAAQKITVNGRPAVMGEKVEGTEDIVVNGKKVTVSDKPKIYLAYNKPVGIICTSDPKAKDNIVDAIGFPERIFHIGRLDVASSGLILLTNDGEIVNKILRASGKHEKEYIVTVDKRITPDFINKMRKGVQLEDGKTLPSRVEQIGFETFSIILVEGRNRQIRRMCDALGFSVKSLERIRIMNIHLGELNVGEWRHLTDAEEKELIATLG
jgi:23S rRNA pseudouridine2604 synthase